MFKSKEEQFDFYWKEIFAGLAYNPIEFNTYRFDQTMSLPGKVNKLYDMFKVLAMNNQEVMDYLKEFVETFDEKMYETLEDVLTVWVEDGRLSDVVRVAISEEVIEARTDYLGKKYVDLKERLDSEKADIVEVTTQLSQIVRLVPIDSEDISNSIQEFYATLETGVTLKVPYGEYELKEPLVFDREIDLDFTGVKFNYSGSGTAITVGIETEGNTGLHGRTYVLPNISRNTLNWFDDVNGIRVVNINTSTIQFGSITSFKKGLIIEGLSYGNSYNHYHLKGLVNNQYSLVLTSNSSGWVNENTFYGGRFGLTSNTKPFVTSENTHVLIEYKGYSQNNNVFSRASFESGANKGVEHVAKIENGRMIYFRDCRYENVYNVDITTGLDIQFTNGFGINNLIFTDKTPDVLETHISSRLNKLLGFSYRSSQSGSNDIGNLYSGSGVSPVITFKGDGSITSKGNIHFTNRLTWGSETLPKVLFNGTSSPVGTVDANPGSIYIKNNTGEIFIKSFGTDSSGWIPQQTIKARSTRPTVDNVVGTLFFDTSLQKPIWWTGANWVDATGSVV